MTAIGNRANQGKPKLSLMLEARHAMLYGTRGLEFGLGKYGRGNYRKGLLATECADSLLRHASAYLAGEDIDEESGLPHVALALSSAVLLAENHGAGTLVDDRATTTDTDVPSVAASENPLSEQPRSAAA